MEKASIRTLNLLAMSKFIPEKNIWSAVWREIQSSKCLILSHPTSQKQKPHKYGKYAVKTHISLYNREFTLVKNPMNVISMGRSLVIAPTLRCQRTHLGRNYKCNDCGKAISDSSQFIMRQRVHTREKPYECSEYGKAYNQHSILITISKLHWREALRPIHFLKRGSPR